MVDQHEQDFVCGLLVDFADGRAGRSDLIEIGSQAHCLRTAHELVGRAINGNRPLSAAHVVIVPREEWDELYDNPDARLRTKAPDVPLEAALAASRSSLELITSQLRVWLPESDAAEIAAKAFVRRGACELVNHVGKERATDILRKELHQAPADVALSSSHEDPKDQPATDQGKDR